MFAKLAQIGHFGRTHNAGPVARPSNDNRPLRVVAAARRPERPVLACHWHVTPSGSLECAWSVDGAPDTAGAAPDPQIFWLNGPVLRGQLAA